MRRFLLRRRVLVGVSALVVLVLSAAALVLGTRGGTGYRERPLRLQVADGPRGLERVRLDVSVFLPDRPGRQPAVILTHGFGADKASVRKQAGQLAQAGYVVLTPSTRGFGASTGAIGLNLPEYDGTDVHAEVSYLATLPQVLLDRRGDPRVGLVGASYGGGISLSGAAADRRVDAVVAVITWNSLASALFPDAADPGGGRPASSRPASTAGVFKQAWAAQLFSGGASRPGTPPSTCGRFVAPVCVAYAAAATTGTASAASLRLLDRAGVAPRIARLRAPTLLMQGEDDTLFPLAEATRTFAALRAAGVPTSMAWLQGGHDAPFGTAGTGQIESRTRQWLDRWLRRDTGVRTGPVFSWQGEAGGTRSAGSYPVPGTRSRPYALVAGGRLARSGAGGSAQIVHPPGGRPASISSVPGLGTLGAAAGALGGSLAIDPPRQAASWTGPVLAAPLQVVGAARVRLRVASSTGRAQLFLKLYDVAASGAAGLPNGQVAPLDVTGLGGTGRDVEVTLPTLAHTFPAGDRVRLVVATTDQAYAPDPAAATVTVAGAGPLLLPAVPVRGGGSSALVRGLLAAAALTLLLAAGGLALIRRNRRRDLDHRGDPARTPMVLRGLTKTYADGHRAVDGVSFTVEAGQVVGLLGPNGAGKTTTLRMALGLIAPSDGTVEIFGERVRPGAPVLARVGAFVEGPGLLPHLSGRDNLILWWRATGADLAAARLDEALEVAGLGDAVDRPVRRYSQGMRQRLAIAQVLLGMPDLLVLDEPTNGLDPPQIREMRELIRRFAGSGRTVLLSSHLLSEVELTCSHAVVMQSGRLIYTGTVEQLLASTDTLEVTVAGDPGLATRVLQGVPGVRRVTAAGDVLTVDAAASRADLVRALVAAGVDVREFGTRRHLEDVFLALVGAADSGHAVRSGGEG